MKNIKPVLYTAKQDDIAEGYIYKTFGNADFTVFDFDSKYVRSNVAISYDCMSLNIPSMSYATFGMGARKQPNVTEDIEEHIELLAFTSKRIQENIDVQFLICEELKRLSKIPFEENLPLVCDAIIPTSKEIKNTFGFDKFILTYVGFHNDIEGLGKCNGALYLILIPIYNSEIEFMNEDAKINLTNILFKKYGNKVFLIDSKRKPLDSIL